MLLNGLAACEPELHAVLDGSHMHTDADVVTRQQTWLGAAGARAHAGKTGL